MSRFILKGPPALRPLRERVQGWLGDFHRWAEPHRGSFEPRGIQPRVTFGNYQVRLDVAVLRNLEDGTKEAWVYHDYVEEHLGTTLAALGVRMAKQILAVACPDVSHVVFYQYQRGEAPRRESIERGALDTNDMSEAISLIEDYLSGGEMEKRPGSHCRSCYHFRQNRCGGPLPG